jgi:hypothetical protein
MSAAEATGDSSDLMSNLDTLDKAEPMAAEDDLILRMQAVSKIRGWQGKGAKEKGTGKSGSAGKPKHSIEKKRRQPKRDAVMRL